MAKNKKIEFFPWQKIADLWFFRWQKLCVWLFFPWQKLCQLPLFGSVPALILVLPIGKYSLGRLKNRSSSGLLSEFPLVSIEK
ncbi:MAG: hypothetical protein FWD26_10200 [Treponema sp.]|nr:hypothetical protein [Treponema sp.]